MSSETALADSDEALMLAYGQGDASAFDVLYGRHKDAVYRYFLRQQYSSAQSQDSSIAEELSHDCWLKIIKHRQSYQVTAKFTTWLFTIAKHTAMDYYQKKHLQLVEAGMDGEQFVDNADSLANANAQQQLQQALQASIALLPVEQRQIFLLKQEAQFSLQEIADITQENKEKVKSSWRYAIDKLRRSLQDYV